ncbi:MAG: transcriptional repressor LexA [Clostridiales bacterium]|jgi:repressor LexA|nr:transcriptional repressor LexA [Clostridiales bacterium]
MPGQLSSRQEKVYEFLKSEIRKKGYPPTVREICDAVNLKSTSTVHAHLEILENKGYIRRSPTKNRSIEILDDNFYGFSNKIASVPLIRRIVEDAPLMSMENIETYFPFPANYISFDQAFMFRVKGDAMVDLGIREGDLILVSQTNEVKNGDIVIALIDAEPVIRSYFHEKDYIRLQPANDAYKSIIIENCLVIGKVHGLYRLY